MPSTWSASNHQPLYIKKSGRTIWYTSSYLRTSKAWALARIELLKSKGVKLMTNSALVARMKKAQGKKTMRKSGPAKKKTTKKSTKRRTTKRRSTKK